jgi:energy-coupling factor transporter ATP-binding protein EcfA2
MLLQAAGLVVRHHASHPPVLAGVDLEVRAGELVAVVGANGSGKSTLARALAGLVALEAGTVSGGRAGLVLQDPAAQLVAATVADEVALGAQSSGRAPADVARIVDERVRAGGLDALWERDPAQLSGGQQQRVAVAAIEACDVDVLVLDEPTALLDEGAARALVARVRGLADSGRGIVWITQEPDEVALCDRVVVLDAGELVWAGGVARYVSEPGLPATWGLEPPVAARVAHALAAQGAWPAGAAMPARLDALAEVLGRA